MVFKSGEYNKYVYESEDVRHPLGHTKLKQYKVPMGNSLAPYSAIHFLLDNPEEDWNKYIAFFLLHFQGLYKQGIPNKEIRESLFYQSKFPKDHYHFSAWYPHKTDSEFRPAKTKEEIIICAIDLLQKRFNKDKEIKERIARARGILAEAPKFRKFCLGEYKNRSNRRRPKINGWVWVSLPGA